MAMGRQKDVQGELLIYPTELLDGGGHLFFEKLNQLLGQHDFDRKVEALCEQYYADASRGSRPSLPPGVYFCICFMATSKASAAIEVSPWRCSDSLALRRVLGILFTQTTKKLAAEEGLVDAKANELRNYDKRRPDKSCSNDDWVAERSRSPHHQDEEQDDCEAVSFIPFCSGGACHRGKQQLHTTQRWNMLC